MTDNNGSFRSADHGVPTGTRLNGIYEIDHMIGVGGMGEVYKGHEIQTGSTVAIKMLLPEMAENEDALALFRKEASALHYLMHDAIVRYFVFSVEPNLQRPYLAMEFVNGKQLSDILNEGTITFDDSLRLMRRVASGLQLAHQHGIIHRDVSPDNIIIPAGDVSRAKIIDFGIARSTLVGDATVIGTGFAGKQNYVSPEQVGLFGGDVKASSDVYSLGLVLFQTLTGEKLDMGGSHFQLVEKRRKVPELSNVDPRIRPLLERMLQPDPTMRPSMSEIESWSFGLGGEPHNSRMVHPERPNGTFIPPRPGRKWRRLSFIAASLIAITIAAVATYYKFTGDETNNSASPQIAPPDLTPAPSQSPPSKANTPSGAPPVLKAEPEDKKDPAEGIRRFVDQYDGGDCFYVTPVAISSRAAVIEGLGSSTAPFEVFDRSFRQRQGFEASIGIRQVSQTQCPAVTFLNRLKAENARAPHISVDSVGLKSGEKLNGMIDNLDNRVVELLLIPENGEVQNLSYLLRPGTDSLLFSINMQPTDNSGSSSVAQLVMAVASSRALNSLRKPGQMTNGQLFSQILNEAQLAKLGISAAIRYIRVER